MTSAKDGLISAPVTLASVPVPTIGQGSRVVVFYDPKVGRRDETEKREQNELTKKKTTKELGIRDQSGRQNDQRRAGQNRLCGTRDNSPKATKWPI